MLSFKTALKKCPDNVSHNYTQQLYLLQLKKIKLKSVTDSDFSLCVCHEVMGPDAMVLVLSMLSFKPAFSLSSLILMERLFSSSSLYAIQEVSSAYLRLLIFLPASLIPACNSSRLAYRTMYFACKLNKQSDNKQP